VRQAPLAIGFAHQPNRQPDLVISEDPEQRCRKPVGSPVMMALTEDPG
jgi:hypothetical protein